MPDRKPPRLAAGERETLLALLQYQRESLVRNVADAPGPAAREPAVGSGTTLLWLVKHMTRAEILWLAVRFAGRDDAQETARHAGHADILRELIDGSTGR